MVIGLKRLSDWAARGLDAVPGTTPNRITALGLILALLAIGAFLGGSRVWGFVFGALSYLTDFLDGALARYQDGLMTPEEREAEKAKHWMHRRGKTEEEAILSGAAFDPFVDKVRYFGILLPLGLGRLWWPLIALGGVFALALTIGRPIVSKMKLSKGKANWLGKHKVHVEAALLLWLCLIPASGRDQTFGNVLLALATFGGAASFGTQAWSVWRNRRNQKAPT